MTITANLETVTPETALDWLTADVNCNNRKLKLPVVRRYARDMQNNNWTFNGDTIKFDWNGKLLDGQHRLHAVIELNQTVQFLVVRNLNPDAYSAIDTGARRTASDMMQHVGSTHASAAAAAAKILHWYLKGMQDFHAVVTTAELVATYRAHPNLEAYVASYDNSSLRRKLHVGAGWAVFSYLVGSRLPEEYGKFLTGVTDGIGLLRGDPRYAVREWFLNRLHRKRMTRNDERFVIIVKGWNAYLENRSLQLVAYKTNETPPKPRMVRP